MDRTNTKRPLEFSDDNDSPNKKNKTLHELIEKDSSGGKREQSNCNNFTVKQNDGQGDCLYYSILEHFESDIICGDDKNKQLEYLENHPEKKNYSDCDYHVDDTKRKILYLRNKVADLLQENKNHYDTFMTEEDDFNIAIGKTRKLGEYENFISDNFIQKELPNVIGKEIRIYQLSNNKYSCNDIKIFQVNEDRKRISENSQFSSTVKRRDYIPIFFTSNSKHYEALIDSQHINDSNHIDSNDIETDDIETDDIETDDETCEPRNINEELKNTIDKYDMKEINVKELIEQTRKLLNIQDTRKIFEKLSQELNKTNEPSVEPCENTDTMASIKRLVSEINEKKKEKYNQNLQDLKYIVRHTNSKTDLKCELLMELHVKKNLYDTWFNRFNGKNDPRTDDLSKFDIRGKRLLYKNLQGELYIKVDDQKIMIIKDNSENSEDIVDVYKITIYEENPNVNDKYSQLSSFLPENVNSTILMCSDWKIHEEFNPEKFNKDTKSEQTLQTLIGILANQSEKEELKQKVKEVFEKQNDGILFNKKIISRDLWDFFSCVKDDTLTSQFFKDLLKVEELCIEDDVFRFSVIEWIALSKKVPNLFQGIIFGLIQSGKTLLLWLILYTHTVLLNEKTIFCGPSDIGIMEQNMKGLKDVIFKHFVTDDVDRREAERKEEMLKLQFFEDKIEEFIESKKGCVMFVKNEPHILNSICESLSKIDRIDNLYFDEAHEIFSTVTTIYKSCLIQIFKIDGDKHDIAGDDITLEMMNEDDFQKSQFGSRLKLILSEQSKGKKKINKYLVEQEIVDSNVKEIGLQVIENDQKYYFQIKFAQRLNIDPNQQIENEIETEIPAVKQTNWEKVMHQVKKRIGYISATPDACYNGLQSFAFMRFLSPKKNYKSPFFRNEDDTTNDNDTIQTVNLYDSVFEWWDDEDDLTVKKITDLMQTDGTRDRVYGKFKRVFEDIVMKYEDYITESSYHLPYLSIGMNIFRKIDDQKDFKNLIDGKEIRVNNKTYIIEAHTVNSETKNTVASVFNEFENKENVREQKNGFPRFCNDDMDKAYYGNQKFHEDRYKNIIHVVISDQMNKRGVANRPERSVGDGGHFAFIQMLKGVKANAETNIQYCRCAANGHIFEQHCKNTSNIAPPTYVYEDGFMETIRQYQKHNLELCKESLRDDFYPKNSEKNLKKIKIEMNLVLNVDENCKMSETREKMHQETCQQLIIPKKRFDYNEFNHEPQSFLKQLWEIYKLCGFKPFVKKKPKDLPINQLRQKNLWEYYFDDNNEFVVFTCGKFKEILKKMLGFDENTPKIKIQKVSSCENSVDLTQSLGEYDRTNDDDTKTMNSFLKDKIIQLEKSESIKCRHFKTNQNDLKDLLKLFIEYKIDYMTDSCGNGKYGILKFIRSGPTTFWDLKKTYKIKDEYFKIDCNFLRGDFGEMKIDCLINYCIYSEHYDYIADVKKRCERESPKQLAPNVVITEKLFYEIYHHTDNSGVIHCFVSKKDFIKIFNLTSTQTINVGHCEEITSSFNDKLKMTQKGDNEWHFHVKSEEEISQFRKKKKLVEEHDVLKKQLKKIFKNENLKYVKSIRKILLDECNNLIALENFQIDRLSLEKKISKDTFSFYTRPYQKEKWGNYPQLFVMNNDERFIINPDHLNVIKDMYKYVLQK